MKFTKEEAYKKLEALLTNEGKKTLRMSSKSMEAQLDALIPLVANDEMELDDFVGKVKVSFETMNSNAEYDNSAFIKKWREEHEEKKPQETKMQETNPDDLTERILDLEKKLAEEEKKKLVESKRKEFKSKLKDKGIKDEDFISSIVDEIGFSEDFDMDSKSESVLKMYNKIVAGVSSNSTTQKTSTTKKEGGQFDYVQREYDKIKRTNNLNEKKNE